MLTAGAVVVACFSGVSAVVQLVWSIRSSKSDANSGYVDEPQRAFMHDRSVALWFESVSVLLFCGTGILWLIDTTTSLGEGCATSMDRITSTVAILSSLAFMSALGRYFVSCSIILGATTALILYEHRGSTSHICGAASYATALTGGIVALARTLRLVLGAHLDWAVQFPVRTLYFQRPDKGSL